MDKIHFKSAVEIARLIRERKVRAIEALEHFVARVEKYNPRLNAVIWLEVGRALERAKAAEDRRRSLETYGRNSPTWPRTDCGAIFIWEAEIIAWALFL